MILSIMWDGGLIIAILISSDGLSQVSVRHEPEYVTSEHLLMAVSAAV